METPAQSALLRRALVWPRDRFPCAPLARRGTLPNFPLLTGTSISMKWTRGSEWACGAEKKERKQDTALPSGSLPPGMQRGRANFVNVLKSTEAEATGQLGLCCHVGGILAWRNRNTVEDIVWPSCLSSLPSHNSSSRRVKEKLFLSGFQLWHESLFLLSFISFEVFQKPAV